MGGRLLILVLAGLALPSVASAQEEVAPSPSSAIGLYGFSARGGVDFEGSGQAVVSVALDAGHLFTDRLRLRPSAEIGFLGGDVPDNTYLANLEVVYRIVGDREVAVPYVGTGLGIFGRDDCGADDACPGVWLQFVLGFEVGLRDGIAWVLEYHPVDAFRRQRILVGLTTRRGP
jgi:hypothetical protein